MSVVAESLTMRTQAVETSFDFNSWMAGEQRRIFLLCYRMLQDRDEADSAAQDTFLKAFKALRGNSADWPDEPAKWLTRVAVNTCLDRLRSKSWKFWRQRPRPEDEQVMLNLAPATGPSAEDVAFAGEIRQRLSSALGRLSDRQRAVFVLKHFEDRRLEEIAEILKLDVGTVKAHMARAVAKLRIELEDLYGLRRSGATP